MQTETEDRVMRPRARNCLQPPEVGRGQNRFFGRGFDSADTLVLNSWLLEPCEVEFLPF